MSQQPSSDQQIRDLIALWLKASAEGDINTVLSLMTDDALFLRPGHEPMTKEVFAASSRAMQGKVKIEGQPDIREIQINGDLAYCWNHLEITITPQGAVPMKHGGDVLTIFRRKPDGRWLLFRDANMLAEVDG